MVRTKVALGLLVAVPMLTACSVSVGSTPTVEQGALQQGVSSKLEQTVGQKPKRVDCPGPLEGKVGTTERCLLTAMDGTTLGLTVTVTSVSGKTVNFAIAVDSTPSSRPKPSDSSTDSPSDTSTATSVV